MLLTDNKVLIRCAEKYYNVFKVPTMVMDAKKRERRFTSSDKASLDEFCNSDRIGVIVNLSQEINTIMWDKVNRNGDWNGALEAYKDNCLLTILSTIAIDSTKREYPIDCDEEFAIVRQRYNEKDSEGRSIRPYFFGHVARKKGYYDSKKKNYLKQMAPMDWVQSVVKEGIDRGSRGRKAKSTNYLTIWDIVSKKDCFGKSRIGYVDLVIAMVRDMDAKMRMIYNAMAETVGSHAERKRLVNDYYTCCVNSIRNMKINQATMRDILAIIDKPENSDIRRKLWSVVFEAFGDSFSELLESVGEPVYTLEERPTGSTGDVSIYGLSFVYKMVS